MAASPNRKWVAGAWLVTLLALPGPAAMAGDIPLIDAHSQIDCNVTEDLVLRQTERLGISRVLISARGCKGWNAADIEARSLQWAADHPDRISVHLSAKVDGWAFDPVQDAGIAAFRRRAGRDGFAGLGEVLVQHAAHDHAKLTFPALSLDLGDRRIEAAVSVARARGWPVILHIELNDFEDRAAKTLTDLEDLLRRYPDTHFGLIHMGQATVDEARGLIERHANIFFLTTTADDFAVHATRKARQRGNVAQTGWINLFEGNCPLNRCPSAWKPAWRSLVTEHPFRFVLAFENVFPPHWEKPYEIKVGIWRRALAMLPDAVAHAVAHGNAERLWKLPPAR